MSYSGPNYLNGLPFDTMEDILKSTIPEVILDEGSDLNVLKDHTTERLGAHDSLSMLFSDCSPFRAVVSTLFSRLIMVGIGPTEFSIERGVITFAPDVFMELESGSVPQIFNICGSSITSIIFLDSFPYSNANEMDSSSATLFAQKLTALLLTHCPNVDELIYDQNEGTTLSWSTGGSVFQKLSSQLRSFEWDNRHFMKLPDLSACRNIRKVSVRFDAVNDLTGMLDPIGKTLEELLVTGNLGYNSCLKMIDTINKHCHRLRKIQFGDKHITPVEHWDNRYASFLCSYGEQLIEASSAKLSPKKLREVIEKCTNLRFQHFMANYRNASEHKLLVILGPRLVQLRLFGNWCYGDEWSKAFSQCTSLQKLTMNDCQIFSSSSPNFPSLKTLEIYKFVARPENISLIASKTVNLCKVVFFTTRLIEDGTIFRSLVNANDGLKDIYLSECEADNDERSTENILKFVGELLKTFSNFRKMILDLADSEEHYVEKRDLHKICSILPCRGVSATIRIGFDFEYHQPGRLMHPSDAYY